MPDSRTKWNESDPYYQENNPRQRRVGYQPKAPIYKNPIDQANDIAKIYEREDDYNINDHVYGIDHFLDESDGGISDVTLGDVIKQYRDVNELDIEDSKLLNDYLDSKKLDKNKFNGTTRFQDLFK